MKTLCVLLTSLALTLSVHAQGTVAFHNNGSTSYRIWTNDLINPPNPTTDLACCGLYRIGLYVSSDLSATESALELVLMTTNAVPTPLAGYFNGGNPRAIPGFAANTQIRFQIRGWTLADGSYEFAGESGKSLLGTTTLGGGPTSPGALFGTSPGLLSQGFCIGPFQCVPEPSTAALGVLATLSLLMARRRRDSRT